MSDDEYRSHGLLYESNRDAPTLCTERVKSGEYSGNRCCGYAGHYVHFITRGKPEGGSERIHEWKETA